MIKKSILDLIFFLISLLALFTLKYLNKVFKHIKKEFTNEEFQNEVQKIEDELEENTSYYKVNIKQNKFKIYDNTNKMSFSLSGEIRISGFVFIPDKKIPKKIIIYFDGISQLKYKHYINKYINAATKEQIRSIYKKLK